MSQGYVKTYPPDIATAGETFATYPAAARVNQSAMNSWHSGTVAPTNPEVNMKWLDTSVATPILYIWDGATWQLIEAVLYPFKEIKDARGTAGSLDARLDQSLNEDGTLKASTTLNPDEWKPVTGTPTRTANNTFTKSTDQTALYQVNRRVKMTPGPNYSRILSSVFSAGVTTVIVADTNVPVSIAAADVALISATAASTALDSTGIASPSGGVIEDYIADAIGLNLVLVAPSFDTVFF